MSEAEVRIRRIQEKVGLLLKQSQELRRENKTLKSELEKAAKEATRQHDQVAALKQQVEVLKIGSGSWDDNDKKAFEKRINQYIREIDKCIVLLGE